jgi:hypothetical protein
LASSRLSETSPRRLEQFGRVFLCAHLQQYRAPYQSLAVRSDSRCLFEWVSECKSECKVSEKEKGKGLETRERERERERERDRERERERARERERDRKCYV